MCTPVGGSPIYATPILENLENGNVSDISCVDDADLGNHSSSSVGCDPEINLSTKNEELTVDLSDHTSPLVENDSELNLNAQNQEPQQKFLRSPEEEREFFPNSNPEVNENDPKSVLQALKSKNLDRPIIAHLNINFLDSKYEPLKSLIKENIDILLVSETKLDDTYPKGQFKIDGYDKPIRLDRNKHGGGLLFFIRDDLPCTELKSHNLSDNVEGIFIELTIRKSKWLIMGGYSPHKENISYLSPTRK